MNPRLFTMLIVAAICTAILSLPSAHVTNLVFAGLSAIVVLGLGMMITVAGLTSFGQAAFVGIGAYASALITTSLGVSSYVGLLASIGASTIAASVLGTLTMRLKSWYLPLGTLAAGLAIYYGFSTSESLGGHTGFGAIPPLAPSVPWFSSERTGGVLVWIGVGVFTILALNLLDSRTGRAMRTLRGKVVMGEAFGIDTAKYKFLIFLIAGIMAGVAGWYYVHIVRFVNPTPFSLTASIEYLFVAVVGGVSSVWGAILGALVLVTARQWLVELAPRLGAGSINFEIVVFGLLVILLLQRTRKGLINLIPWLPVNKPELLLLSDTAVESLPDFPPTTLEVVNVRKAFGGLVAVSDVSFSVSSGTIVGLIGPNGAGKSTLFNIVSGIQKSDRGQVSLSGHSIEGLRSREIARMGLSRTFQHVQIRRDLSCIENVAIGAHLRGRAGVVRAICRLDRKEEQNLLSEAMRQLTRVGLAAEAELDAGKLSLGKQRLLEVARALALRPRILLLDEPAAGLRHREKRELAELLEKIRSEGVGVLIVEHDMTFLMSLADHVVVMVSGSVLAQGRPETIQTDSRVVDAYLGYEDEQIHAH